MKTYILNLNLIYIIYIYEIILRETEETESECVPGSERVVKAINGRLMLKCTCAECGITKTKFVKQAGNGLARRKGRAY